MLLTLLNWLYILFTCYICGFFVLTRLYKGRVSVCGSIFAGIAILTAYSEYFSLFAGVGLIANLLLIILCMVFFAADMDRYRKFAESLSSAFLRKGGDRLIHIITLIISAAVILVCAYFTASSAFTYDTGTYHAQSIHWIESYGVVKGLAHMQTRLGFNNSYFALCALFSFHFLGQSMHALSGFHAALVMTYSLLGYAGLFKADDKGKIHFGKLRLSDFVRIGPFAYFVITAVEITSPSTDYGVIWMILWLVIRWTECMEDDIADKTSVYSLLSVFSVFLVTVKLSVGVLVLITIYPLVFLIKEKKIKDIVMYILAGLILVLPFFIRNYLITGWLVYPFPAVDLFDPDWKVPLDGVRHEADEIVVWARYTKDTALIDQGIREWFPVWWKEQGAGNRLLSSSAFAGCIVLLVSMLLDLRRTVKERSHIFMGGILLVSFLFFMFSAPSNRFGYSYILLIPLYAAGYLCLYVLPVFIKKKQMRVLAGLVLSLLLLSGMLRGLRIFASDDKNMALNTGVRDYLIAQKDYPRADALSEEWEGMTIYYPVNEGEQIWYHAFPAILYRGNLEGTARRGDSVRDGFLLK